MKKKHQSPQTIGKMGNGPNIFHVREILPHFQSRLEATEKIMKDIPKDNNAHIGMKKIKAKSSIGRYFVDFAGNSTIHGFNHLAAPQRHPVESFLVVLIILGSLACLITLSLDFWDRYRHNATVTNLDYNYHSFVVTRPALIMCPIENFVSNNVKTIFQKHNVVDTKEAREFFKFLSNVTYQDMKKTPDFNQVPPDKWLPILYDLHGNIRYRSDETSIAPLFENWIVTERGICLTFDNYVSVYASMEYWRSNNWTIIQATNPLPSFNYTTAQQLYTLNFDVDVLFSAYDPQEIMEYNHNLRRLEGLSKHDFKLVSIAQVDSTSRLKFLSVTRRKCKYPKDNSLRLWPIYTRKMCLMECRFNLIRTFCGCYPHFARTMAGIPICNAAQLRCIGDHSSEFIHLKKEKQLECGCIINCDTVSYEIEGEATEYKTGGFVSRSIIMGMQFPKEKFVREELFSFTDFLVSVGGAAGLFLGASVLSFVEIFYYACIRLFRWLCLTKRR